MAISVVQRNSGKNNNAGTDNASVAFGSNNTAGNTIIAISCGADTTANLHNSDFQPISDSQSNTYKEVFTEFSDTWNVGIKVWVAEGIASGANTVTIVDNNDEQVVFLYEVSGLATNAFDRFAFTKPVAGSGSFDSGTTPTLSFANQLVLGVFVTIPSGTWSAGGGYSNLQSDTTATSITAAAEEKIVSATTAVSATATNSVTTQNGIAAVLTFADTTNTTVRVQNWGSWLRTANSGTKTMAFGASVGDRIIVATFASGNTATTAPTDNNADGNGSYTLIASALKNGSADIMCVFTRNSAIGNAGLTTVSHAPGTTSGGGIEVWKVLNTTKTGTATILNSATQANQSSGTTPAPAFGAAPASTSPIISWVFDGTNSSARVAPRTNYNMGGHDHYGTPATGFDSIMLQSGESSATITWGGTVGSAYSSLAIEVDGSVSGGTQTINATGLASTAALGSPTMVKGAVSRTITGIASTAALGSPTVRGVTHITPTGIASGATLGSPTLTKGVVNITPTGKASTVAFGTPTFTKGVVYITPSGITNVPTLGSPTIASTYHITPTGIASTAALGSPTLVPGSVTITTTGIDSTLGLGTPGVHVVQTITATGIDSTATLGTPVLAPGAVTITVTSLASTAAVGTAHIGIVNYISLEAEVDTGPTALLVKGVVESATASKTRTSTTIDSRGMISSVTDGVSSSPVKGGTVAITVNTNNSNATIEK